MKRWRSGRTALAGLWMSTVACGSMLGGVELDDDSGTSSQPPYSEPANGSSAPIYTDAVGSAVTPTPAASASDTPLTSAGEPVLAPNAPDGAGNDCEDGEFRCTDALLEYCDAGRWLAWQQCASAATCESQPAGRCLPPTCAPGTRRCNGAALQLCNDDASGWDELELCATAAHCDASLEACREVPCLPGDRRCNDGSVESCRADLLGWDVVEQCVSAALCEYRADEQSAECRAPACSDGDDRCSDDGTLQTCSLDRTGFVSVASCGSADLCNASEGRCEAPIAVAEPRADDAPGRAPSLPSAPSGGDESAPSLPPPEPRGEPSEDGSGGDGQGERDEPRDGQGDGDGPREGAGDGDEGERAGNDDAVDRERDDDRGGNDDDRGAGNDDEGGRDDNGGARDDGDRGAGNDDDNGGARDDGDRGGDNDNGGGRDDGDRDDGDRGGDNDNGGGRGRD